MSFSATVVKQKEERNIFSWSARELTRTTEVGSSAAACSGLPKSRKVTLSQSGLFEDTLYKTFSEFAIIYELTLLRRVSDNDVRIGAQESMRERESIDK
jgi:hypothetical protein